MSNDKNAKERILEASIILFSKHGFDATGVRKIAEKADVNLSMINYYFKSKEGILLELSDIFFNQLESTIKENNLLSLEIEERFQTIFRELTIFLRENQELFKVIVYTNSVAKIEFNQIKAEKMKRIIGMLYGQNAVSDYLINKDSEFPLNIIGPGIVGLTFSHFIFKDLVSTVTSTEFDDEFYEKYPKILSKIFLHGIKEDLEKFIK